jgi:anthranilate synthase component 2
MSALLLTLLCVTCMSAGDVVRAPCGVMHGKTSPVHHTNKGVLEGLEK